MGIVLKCFYASKSLCRTFFFKLRCRNFSCGKLPYFRGNVDFTLRKNSQVSFGNYIRIDSESRVAVRDQGKLIIKDNVRININAVIYCHDSITIGSNTQIGPYCQIYDHDHKFDSLKAFDNQEFKTAPIEIGNHCWIGANCIIWIGANCIILRGTKIGDNCVIAAGTILKGNYPDNSIIYNKRETVVKLISRDT